MPSLEPGPGGDRRRAGGGFGLLRSQGLGVACGLSTALLLAVGSIVITATRDGASARLQMDDVKLFFREPAIAHLWFYLLVLVLGVYALNTVLCTWHATVGRLRRGVRAAAAHAPAVMHVAFLVALLAHGVGGLWSREGRPLAVGPDWTALPSGERARVVALDQQLQPDGEGLRQVRATLELRAADGQLRREVVAFNQPLSSGFGSDLLLLVRYGALSVARLSDGTRECLAAPGDRCSLGASTLMLVAIHPSGHWGNRPAVALQALDGPDAGQHFFVLPGSAHALAGGKRVELRGVEQGGRVLLRSRHAPGNPWALASALLFGIGLVMFGRRWL